MKSINITRSECKRNLSGLIKKIENGKLDKVSIRENDRLVAVVVSPWVMANPLANSRNDLKDKCSVLSADSAREK